MINFWNGFLTCNPKNGTIEDAVGELSGNLTQGESDYINCYFCRPKAHINYVRDLIGVDYVGIGADYDGGIANE